MDQLAQRKETIKAAHAYAGNAVVFFCPDAGRGRAESNGSGTALRTPKGRIVILTAWHCVETALREPHTFGYHLCKYAIEDPFEDVIRAPEAADVALAIPKSHVAAEIQSHALSTSSVARADDFEIRDEHWFVITGYPAAFRWNVVDRKARKIDQSFAGFGYTCMLDGIDERKRYRILWQEAIDNETGDVRQLPHPGGMSGGALWRFTGGTPPSELWTAQSRGKIVGVQESYLNKSRIALAESVGSWGAWFEDAVRVIDQG